jgi:phenylpyruvate tautomerase PptA (4-oxalocrotonate tautomerase family)
MSWITCDMRFGRTEEQKRQLAAGVIAAVRKATGEPLSNLVFVIHEDVGVNFCEAGQHYPDYKPGGDAELIAQVKSANKK